MKQAVIDTVYAMGGSYFETLEWCASEVATDRQIGEKNSILYSHGTGSSQGFLTGL